MSPFACPWEVDVCKHTLQLNDDVDNKPIVV